MKAVLRSEFTSGDESYEIEWEGDIDPLEIEAYRKSFEALRFYFEDQSSAVKVHSYMDLQRKRVEFIWSWAD